MRSDLIALLPPLLSARTAAQAQLDAHILVQVARDEAGSPLEEKAQKLGALVRQLDEAVRAVRSAADNLSQIEQHEPRVLEWLATKEAP